MMRAAQWLKKPGGRRIREGLTKSKGTTIIQWTGRGRLASLESSVSLVLKDARMLARIWRNGSSIAIEGPEPTALAALFRYMPGISWIAVGKSAGSLNELGGAASGLARNYLRRGVRFAVTAEATGGAVASDVAGAVASAALEAARGARIDEEAPRIRLRAAFDGKRGAVGVELVEGPGGTTVGSAEATCLVSGGKHSSVVAWMALVSGYAVRLLHARVDDHSLRAAARLYSELSNRVDYSRLRLEVLEGNGANHALGERARRAKGHVFGGFHIGCSSAPMALKGLAEAPLFVLPEEEFDAKFSGLGIRACQEKQKWNMERVGRVSSRSFGGAKADVSRVLDGLR